MGAVGRDFLEVTIEGQMSNCCGKTIIYQKGEVGRCSGCLEGCVSKQYAALNLELHGELNKKEQTIKTVL